MTAGELDELERLYKLAKRNVIDCETVRSGVTVSQRFTDMLSLHITALIAAARREARLREALTETLELLEDATPRAWASAHEPGSFTRVDARVWGERAEGVRERMRKALAEPEAKP